MAGISNLEEYFRVNVEKKIFMYDYHPFSNIHSLHTINRVSLPLPIPKRDHNNPTHFLAKSQSKKTTT